MVRPQSVSRWLRWVPGQDCSGADVEHPQPMQRAGRLERVEHPVGVAGAGRVILVGDRIEQDHVLMLARPCSDRCNTRPMELHRWPAEFARKKRGENCPQCEAGRVDETEHGVRYFAGDHADGYLQRQGPTPGYSVVIFCGRHVGDPQSTR